MEIMFNGIPYACQSFPNAHAPTISNHSKMPWCGLCGKECTPVDANPTTNNAKLTTGDAVNHPPHYQTIPGIECIDVARFMNFNKGNALKYLWRAGAKGDEIEDLKKSIWYINDEIGRLEKERAKK